MIGRYSLYPPALAGRERIEKAQYCTCRRKKQGFTHKLVLQRLFAKATLLNATQATCNRAEHWACSHQMSYPWHATMAHPEMSCHPHVCSVLIFLVMATSMMALFHHVASLGYSLHAMWCTMGSANPNAVVRVRRARFTVLYTRRLFRSPERCSSVSHDLAFFLSPLGSF